MFKWAKDNKGFYASHNSTIRADKNGDVNGGGIISSFVFTSDTETVTRTKLNNLVANLKTEFNGSIDNSNIKAAAGIIGSKLDLSAPGAIGGTTPAAGTFTDIVSTGGTIDDTTIGGNTPAAVTGTVIKADTSIEIATGATVTGIADEDDMSSDSATLISTQQSIKAYVDTSVSSADEKIKAWIQFNGSGTVAIQDSFNVSGLVDDGGTGTYTISWDTDFANNDYAIIGSANLNSFVTINTVVVGSTQIEVRDSAGVLADATIITLIAIGDQ